MNPAPLILCGYHVEQLSFSTNPCFDLESPARLELEDFRVESTVEEQPFIGDNLWQVQLQVVQNLGEGKNSPYNFAVVVNGLFEVAEGFPSERSRRLVETNGRSLLYGTCREIIRAATSQGPYQPLLLPSISFYEPEGEPNGPTRIAEDSPN